jgi:CBS domain-containing protein
LEARGRAVAVRSLDVEPRVRDAMSTDHVPLDEGHLLVDALEEMDRLAAGAIQVVAASGSLKGLLVWRDAVKALREPASGSLTVGEVCRSGVAVGLDDSLQTAIGVLDAEQVGHVPVVDGRKPTSASISRDSRDSRDNSRDSWRRISGRAYVGARLCRPKG